MPNTEKLSGWDWVAIIMIVIAVFALWYALSACSAHAQCHGVERWSIKTLQDAPKLAPLRKTTIAEQCALSRPTGHWLTLKRQPSEDTMLEISGSIVAFGAETDSDFHVVLSDGHNTMICECPKPECANPDYASKFKAVRAWLIAKFGRPHGIKKVHPTKVTIRGVGFFDKIAHGSGHAPNGREIHPMLSIQ